MDRFRIAFPYLLFAAIVAGVVGSNFRAAGPPSGPLDPEAAEHVDPVCRMEVNPSWGFDLTHEGETIYFCTSMCRESFRERPDDYAGERCLVCRASVEFEGAVPATYLERTYHLCSEEHRAEFKADPAGFFMHRMWGIPDWMYYLSIAALLVVSFLMFEGVAALRAPAMQAAAIPIRAVSRRPAGPRDRIDLLRIAPIRALLLSRPFRFVVQLLLVAVFLLIIAAGLFGNQNPGLNIAPILTWTVWWGGLVLLIMFAGKAWCYMCPWDAIAGWMEKLRFWKKTDEGSSLNLRWPRVVRNIAIATILFVGLTWVELGFGVTLKPAATAYLGIAMLVMAIVSAFLFERKGFCRYGCLVGRISGLYAMFSGVEIRSRDQGVCRTCHTKECVHGSETAYGCPTFEYPGTMRTNTYCIQCTECLQACPHDNLAVNLRPWGEDLKSEGRPRRDEAYLALLMLGLTGFHGLTMTPVWAELTAGLASWLPLGEIGAFSLGMAGLMAAPILVYAGLVWISWAIATGGSRVPSAGSAPRYFDYFIRYAYCLLPIALFYHLAHNLEHLLMEGQKVIVLASDPFGWGWNVLGTAGWTMPPLVSLDVLWVLQVVLVAVGHVYSLWAANKISRRQFGDAAVSARGQWPLLVGMVLFSVFSLWLLKQPMEMRTSAM